MGQKVAAADRGHGTPGVGNLLVAVTTLDGRAISSPARIHPDHRPPRKGPSQRRREARLPRATSSTDKAGGILPASGTSYKANLASTREAASQENIRQGWESQPLTAGRPERTLWARRESPAVQVAYRPRDFSSHLGRAGRTRPARTPSRPGGGRYTMPPSRNVDWPQPRFTGRSTVSAGTGVLAFAQRAYGFIP